MHNYKRIFVASSEIFSGFKVEVDIRMVETRQDIVDIFIGELKSVLKKNNFEVLLEKVKYENKWHIHSHTMEEILTSNCEDTFYVCNHCN